MGRFALFVFVLLWMIYTIQVTLRYLILKRRVSGLDHPELWLSHSERRAHARKLLRREDDEYTRRVIEETTRYIQQEGQQSQ